MTTQNQLEGNFYHYLYSTGQANAAWNQQVIEFYVQYLAECEDVLDVGCGEGRFMELLIAQGINASGVDLDAEMVRICREKGLDVVEANLFDYLPKQTNRFDGIYCSNLIEHLSAQDALQFIQIAFSILRPGGVLLIATPNPSSLIVHLHEFWRDATHVRLYNGPLLEFLLWDTGFREIQSGENPKTAWVPPAEFQLVPKWLQHLGAEGRSGQAADSIRGLAEEATTELKQPFWKRLARVWRRRLARFLAQTIMFDEFAAIRQILQVLYQTQSHVLLAQREIFAKGVKPVVGREMR